MRIEVAAHGVGVYSRLAEEAFSWRVPDEVVETGMSRFLFLSLLHGFPELFPGTNIVNLFLT